MNNNELNKFRMNFCKKLEEHIKKKNVLTKEEFDMILYRTILQSKVSTETSNKIMVYMGTFMEKNHLSGKEEYITFDDNLSAKYKLYIDLETADVYKVAPKNDKQFKEEYYIISLPVKLSNKQEYSNNYDKLKIKFFNNLLYNSQEDVVKTLKKQND